MNRAELLRRMDEAGIPHLRLNRSNHFDATPHRIDGRLVTRRLTTDVHEWVIESAKYDAFDALREHLDAALGTEWLIVRVAAEGKRDRRVWRFYAAAPKAKTICPRPLYLQSL